jgi:hypothetical protein
MPVLDPAEKGLEMIFVPKKTVVAFRFTNPWLSGTEADLAWLRELARAQICLVELVDSAIPSIALDLGGEWRALYPTETTASDLCSVFEEPLSELGLRVPFVEREEVQYGVWGDNVSQVLIVRGTSLTVVRDEMCGGCARFADSDMPVHRIARFCSADEAAEKGVTPEQWVAAQEYERAHPYEIRSDRNRSRRPGYPRRAERSPR